MTAALAHPDRRADVRWRLAAADCRARLRALAPVVGILCGPASDEDRAYYESVGGDSVSVRDLCSALDTLGASRVDVVDVTRTPDWLDRVTHADVVLINLHGSPGEDGTVQAALQTRSIRFVGSAQAASALALDKGATKRLAVASGVPTPRHAIVVDGAVETPSRLRPGLPRIAKPVRGGSSLGVRLLDDDEPWPLHGEWIVEEFVVGCDVTVTVCECAGAATALPAIVLSHRGTFYDAAAKLVGDPSYGATASRPAALAAALGRCEALALQMHRAIGAAHVTRSDFVVGGGLPFFLETNTLPGLSRHGNVAECARLAGLDHPDLVAMLVAAALDPPLRRPSGPAVGYDDRLSIAGTTTRS